MALRGGIITKRPLCCTTDGRLLLAPCGSEIRVYSAKSGDHIATLRGHEAEVTSVVQDPGSDKLVLSSSLDGTLRQWDVQEGTALQTWAVRDPIESMVFSKQTSLAYVSIHYKGGQSGRVVPYLLPSGEEAPGRVKTSSAGQLVLSPSGAHVAVMDRNSLFVWAAGSSASGKRAKPLNLPHTKPYTCAAFDPTDSIVAAGDASGRILIWHDFTKALAQWTSSASGNTHAAAAAAAALATQPAAAAAAGGGGFDGGSSSSSGAVRLPACTTVHWHANAVGAVCFSLGGHLLSGGQEGVLVQWSLPSNKRTYLPRLGGPLKAITTSRADPARFVISQSDNTVRLVNTASMSVELSIHGLRPPPAAAAALAAAGYGACCSAAASSPSGVVLAPVGGALVLPADQALLQFFDVAREKHLARLQVSPRNPVSPTELHTNHAAAAAAAAAAGQGGAAAAAAAAAAALLSPAVVLVAFTPDGEVLVTVDVRPATGAYSGAAAESTLRFWDRTSGSQLAGSSAPYTLNTSADSPHRGSVTGLSCHPWQHMAVTTGSEGEFRVWVRAKTPAQKHGSAAAAAAVPGSSSSSSSHWRCSAVGGYKGLALSGCSFSHDGSLLAVAAGTTATLWDPYDNTLVAALCCPAECSSSGSSLRQLVFLKNSPHLVGLLGGGDCAAAAAAVGLSGSCLQQQQQQLLSQVHGSWGCGVVVWDLITSTVSWYCSLPVCSLAADPAHPVFAVGVPALIANSTTAGQPEQQQQQQQQRQRGAGQGLHKQHTQGLVVVFGPTNPTPVFACPVPSSSPASLLFMPTSSSSSSSSSTRSTAAKAGMEQQQQQQQQMSPLLLLTEDRHYTWLAPPQSAAAAAGQGNDSAAAAAGGHMSEMPAGTRAAMEAELVAGGDESALEAMFGKIGQPAPAAAGGVAAAAAAEAAAVKAAVAQLFDAPSHVLPAPTALCPTLLELLIGAGRR